MKKNVCDSVSGDPIKMTPKEFEEFKKEKGRDVFLESDSMLSTPRYVYRGREIVIGEKEFPSYMSDEYKKDHYIGDDGRVYRRNKVTVSMPVLMRGAKVGDVYVTRCGVSVMVVEVGVVDPKSGVEAHKVVMDVNGSLIEYLVHGSGKCVHMVEQFDVVRKAVCEPDTRPIGREVIACTGRCDSCVHGYDVGIHLGSDVFCSLSGGRFSSGHSCPWYKLITDSELQERSDRKYRKRNTSNHVFPSPENVDGNTNKPETKTIDYKPLPWVKEFHKSDSFVRVLSTNDTELMLKSCCMEMFFASARQTDSADGLCKSRWCVIGESQFFINNDVMRVWMSLFPETVYRSGGLGGGDYTYSLRTEVNSKQILIELFTCGMNNGYKLDVLKRCEFSGVFVVGKIPKDRSETVNEAIDRGSRYPNFEEGKKFKSCVIVGKDLNEVWIPHRDKARIFYDGYCDDNVCASERTELQKPPLGIIPSYIHNDKRIQEILGAIGRYSANGMIVPDVWIVELGDRLKQNGILGGEGKKP